MACEIRRGARCKRRLQPELMSGTLPETYTKRGVGWKWGYGRRGESEGWDGWMDGRKKKEGHLEGLSRAKCLRQPD